MIQLWNLFKGLNKFYKLFITTVSLSVICFVLLFIILEFSNSFNVEGEITERNKNEFDDTEALIILDEPKSKINRTPKSNGKVILKDFSALPITFWTLGKDALHLLHHDLIGSPVPN